MKIFTQIASALVGLLAGGSFLIAIGLAPYWRSLDPALFTQVFAANLSPVGGAMAVLTILGTGSMVIVAGLALWKKLPNRFWFAASAAFTLVMIATVPIYFGAANPLLASGTLSAEEIPDEFATWHLMQWFRTIMGILALFCAIRAGHVTKQSS